MLHKSQTANLKKALREASARLQAAGALPGNVVPVWELGIIDTDPFVADLVKTEEHAVELIGQIVFLVETGRFGVKHSSRYGYIPLDAQNFVRSLTRHIDSPAEASGILMPYFEAVRELS